MSKVKKLVSLVLAAVMVLSLAPMSSAYLTYTSADSTEFTYGAFTYSNPPAGLIVDTSETTEIVRLADKNSETVLGNYIYEATPSGVAKTAGFTQFAYAGEIPAAPKIIMKVYGISSVDDISAPTTPQCSQISSASYQKSTENFTDNRGSGVRYIWTMGNLNGTAKVDNGPDTDLVWTITFTQGRTTYTAYAYAHTEYVLRPNGVAIFAATTGSNRVHGSTLTTIQGQNTKSGWVSSTEGNVRARINYSSTDWVVDDSTNWLGQAQNKNTKSLKGLSYAWDEGDMTSGFLVREQNTGNVVYHFPEKGGSSGSTNNGTFAENPAGNQRAVSTVWVDQDFDVLDKDPSGKTTYTGATATNGLNLRMDWKVGEFRFFYDYVIYRMDVDSSSSSTLSDQVDNNSTVQAITGNNLKGQNVNYFKYVNEYRNWNGGTGSAYSTYNSGGHKSGYGSAIAEYAANCYSGDVPYLTDYSISENTTYWSPPSGYSANQLGNGYMEVPIIGTGPASTQANNSNAYTVTWVGMYKGKNRIMDGNAYNDGKRITAGASMSVRFVTYRTKQLRELIDCIDGIDRNPNDDSDYTMNDIDVYNSVYGKSITNQGAYPQESAFTSGWTNYMNAYHAAKAQLAMFDTTQANINAAITNLENAYAALVKEDEGEITVRHRISGTSIDLVPAVTYKGFDINGDVIAVDDQGNLISGASATVVTPFKAGGSFTANPLTKCTGYTLPTTQFKGSASFAGGTVLKDQGGSTISNSDGELVFNYSPASNSLKIRPNNSYNGIYIQSVSTGVVPDFDDYKTETSQGGFGRKAHYNFVGFYENSDFSGTAIDEDNWTMPATASDLYVKWDPIDVELVLKTSYSMSTPVPFSSQVVVTPTEDGDGNLQYVSFNRPTPPTEVGLTFVEYYYDSNFTTPITWPLQAGYDSISDLEDEGTLPDSYLEIDDSGESGFISSGNNTVTIYAKYVDLRNSIYFEPQGGTLPTDFVPSAGTYSAADSTLTFSNGDSVDYPVPTKNGYIFTGWTVENNGSYYPVNSSNISNIAGAWTQVDPSTGELSPVENGTVSFNSIAGFICYATWKPKDLTIRFRLDIDPSETSIINDLDSEDNPFYIYTHAHMDQPIASDSSYDPPTPRRYGYGFKYWKYNGNRVNPATDKFPIDPDGDGVVEFVAEWGEVNNVLFGELVSFVEIAGEYRPTDNNPKHGGVVEQSLPGDIVTMRFYASGKLSAASSSFIFAYDSDFFEKVTDVDVFGMNQENNYISAMNAQKWEYMGNYYDSIASHTIPGTSTTVSNIKTMQVTLDPDVSNPDYCYTASMDDISYILEVKMRIKETATGDGSMWLCTDLLRTADNMDGDVFVATSGKNPVSLFTASLHTDTVTFDAPVVTTIELDPQAEPRQDYSVTLKLPYGNGAKLGEFADKSSVARKTYTGPEGTEIVTTYTIPGVYVIDEYTGEPTSELQKFQDIPTPERTGYHIGGWYKYTGTSTDENPVDDAESIDETDEWTPSFYATAEQDGNTYQVKWIANDHVLRFYNDPALTESCGSKAVVYDQVGVQNVDFFEEGTTFKFYGWIPEGLEATDANIVNFDDPDDPDKPIYRVTSDANFYAYYGYKPMDVGIQAYVLDAENNKTYLTTAGNTPYGYKLNHDVQEAVGLDLRFGDTLKIVETVPATPEDGVQYLTVDMLNKLMKGQSFVSAKTGETVSFTAGLSSANASNYEIDTTALPVTLTVTASKENNTCEVLYVGADVTVTFRAGEAELNANCYIPGTYSGSYPTSTYEASPYENVEGDEVNNTIVCWTVTGKYQTSYDVATATAGLNAPFGFTFRQWSPQTNLGTYTTATYTAQYSPATINIHYLADDGITEVGTDTLAYNSTQSKTAPVPATVPTGHTYAGYKPASKAPGATAYSTSASSSASKRITKLYEYDSYITVTNGVYDIYFMPEYTANKYNVIYKTVNTVTNAETTVETVRNVVYGTTYTIRAIPAAPTGFKVRKGTVNTGDVWFNGATEVKPGDVVTMDATDAVTYIAYYDPETYTITYDSDGGTAIPSISYPYGAEVDTTIETEKEGYDFGGWTYSPALGEGDTMPASHVTATAIWTPSAATYVVEIYKQNIADDYYTEDNDATVTVNTYVGTTITRTDVATYEVAPTGFNYKETVFVPSDGVVPTSGELVVKIYFDRNVHTVSYSVDGEPLTTAQYKYGAAVTDPTPAPTKTGYSFIDWTYATLDTGNTMPDADVTATANFDIESYTIHFDTDGGSTINDLTVAYGGTINVAAPTKTGYTFDGWTTQDTAFVLTANANLTGDDLPATMPDVGVNGTSVTVTAQWKINQYTITFTYGDVNNGAEITHITQDYNTAVTAPANPTFTGWTFQGWGAAIPENMPAENRTIPATWTRTEYSMTFDPNGGNWNGSTDNIVNNVAYEVPVTAPANPAMEGYTFDGWTYSPALGAGNAMPASNVTATAGWTIETYNLVFDLAGGTTTTSPLPATVEYNAAVTVADPTKDGYTFTGWTGAGVAEGALPTSMPDVGADGETATYTATWRINQYTITLNYNYTGAPESGAITANYGATVSAPANPTRAGYDFGGWYTEAGCQNAYTFSTMPLNGTEVFAKWTPHTYSVVYNWNGATKDAAQPAAEDVVFDGAALALPVFNDDFYYTGWTFTGWYTDSSCSEETKLGSTFTVDIAETDGVGAQAMNGATINLYAGFSQNEYTITFDSDGGSEVATMTKHYNESIQAPEDPTKTGFTFAGWFYADLIGEHAGQEFTAWTTMPAENINLKAHWEEIDYTVKFVEARNVTPSTVDSSATAEFADNLDAWVFVEFTGINYQDTITGAPAAGPEFDAQRFSFVGWSEAPNGTVIADIAAWQLTNVPETGTVIYIYPVYERVEVSFKTEADDPSIPYVIDTEGDDGIPPVTGYIYSLGDKKTKAQIEAELEFSGDGEVVVVPSKQGKICGTGTKIQLKDKAIDFVVEEYYMIVFGDVDGSAHCSAVDLSRVGAYLNAEPANRTWGLANTVAELDSVGNEDAKKLWECYNIAADVNADGTITSDDKAIIECYTLHGITEYDLDTITVTVEGQPVEVKRYKAKVENA